MEWGRAHRPDSPPNRGGIWLKDDYKNDGLILTVEYTRAGR